MNNDLIALAEKCRALIIVRREDNEPSRISFRPEQLEEFAAALRTPPEGWKMAPIKPTPEMSAKGLAVSEAEHDPAGVYMAMIAAAPPMPSEPPPCGWKKYHTLIVDAYAYLATSMREGEVVTESMRNMAMRLGDCAQTTVRAILAAAPMPSEPKTSIKSEPVFFSHFEMGSHQIDHQSDCAVHNEPAYPNGPCDCGAVKCDCSALVEALEKLDRWCEAYPLDIFREPDLDKVANVLEANDMTLDAVSAHNFRYVLNGVRKIIEPARAAHKDAK